MSLPAPWRVVDCVRQSLFPCEFIATVVARHFHDLEERPPSRLRRQEKSASMSIQMSVVVSLPLLECRFADSAFLGLKEHPFICFKTISKKNPNYITFQRGGSCNVIDTQSSKQMLFHRPCLISDEDLNIASQIWTDNEPEHLMCHCRLNGLSRKQ